MCPEGWNHSVQFCRVSLGQEHAPTCSCKKMLSWLSRPGAGRLGTLILTGFSPSLVDARKFVLPMFTNMWVWVPAPAMLFSLAFHLGITFPAPGLDRCISSCCCLSLSSLQERGADTLDWSEQARPLGSLPLLGPVEWALQKSFLHVLCDFKPLVLFLMSHGPAVSS